LVPSVNQLQGIIAVLMIAMLMPLQFCALLFYDPSFDDRCFVIQVINVHHVRAPLSNLLGLE